MNAAFASPPPRFPFASRDLRARARIYFERALLLSALTHLSLVAAIRLAQRGPVENDGGREIRIVLQPPIDVPQPVPPWTFSAPPSASEEGIVVPVVDKPVIDVFKPGRGGDVMAIPADVEGSKEGGPDPKPGPPREPSPEAFRYASTPPVPVDAPIPPYPDWMREAQIEGRVVLKVLVGTDGVPKRIVIVSGSKMLGEEASKALMRWRFRAGMSNGQPVEVWTEIPVNYRLER